MSDLYDTDILLWSERQAELLRRLAEGEQIDTDDLDWTNLAEEIEAVGISQRRELSNRMVRLLHHLLKYHYQPELRSRSWRSTIRTQRREIGDLLADSPSLRPTLAAALVRAYPNARQDALDETGLLDLPVDLPFTIEQVLEAELPAL
jgi:hypothetical protein